MENIDLYTLIEMSYIDKHKNEDINDIFPRDWYSKRNYELKIKILIECINNNRLVIDSKLYNDEFKNDIRL